MLIKICIRRAKGLHKIRPNGRGKNFGIIEVVSLSKEGTMFRKREIKQAIDHRT